jgi:hypothetical protein
MIKSGDMEQLAMFVLNGEGRKLIGRKTNQKDIQGFIDNVHNYMVGSIDDLHLSVHALLIAACLIMQDKIRKVHISARDGNLRDLQAALDRRKFATAKDEISPKGTC